MHITHIYKSTVLFLTSCIILTVLFSSAAIASDDFTEYLSTDYSPSGANNLPLDLQIDFDDTLQTDVFNESAKLPLAFNIAAIDKKAMVNITGKTADEVYEDRIFTTSKIHKYLGIGAIALAGVTILAPKEEDGLHESAAHGTALLGLLAVATGLAFHYDDISIEGGLDDPDNKHALLGTIGALALILAADTGPDSPHATYGSLGALTMLYAIKIEW